MMKGNAVMHGKGRNRGLRRPALLVALALVGATMATLTPAATAETTPRVGIACTTGVGGGATTPIFNLTTKTGYINLPDGNTAFMWGYSSGFGGFQHPGPVLCVNAGDTVTVILRNTLPEPASIVFPGQTNVLANGIPAQPQLTGAGAITSLTNTADAAGGTITYSFTAANPGTYLYESGTNPEKQVRMGLFGALIVRPSAVPLGGAGGSVASEYANNRADSRFNPAEEFMVLLSEIDPYQHQAVENNKSFNLNNYHPRYWLINGRGFPDSIADNGASWLPTQPYGALAQIGEFNTADPADQPGMARYLNVGTEDYPFHPHGNNGLVVARDGRPLEGPTGQDLSFEKFAINLGPGQTWDVIFKWYDAENYSPSNPVPVTVPQLANESIGVFYSGSPYLGTKETLPPGIQSVNQCGEYYIISHNHALFQITSWGANMTGPITYMRIDPPTPNNCG
ncbi:multicopper oxidase domain-containing protein [Cryobacterium sp. PH29-G1]|uniref:multicopper oxidase domain-containing protein n=1 Tax=Cryobacterium sp. PH29-G1 TaxID=3046211 RepID=UPI0024BA310D|nr:multicopper oxidase domain-containing protein [Cryobacterium sp. PH29-G1]MDJ0350524.1 multicopper oxidase domain-containing protein [Cryobacterium sp. PH29-G1]